MRRAPRDALNTRTLPDELRTRLQWVAYRLESAADRPEKPRKVPYASRSRRADTTDPATWLDYDDAVRLARSSGFDGVGFVFAPDDPYVGVDLDGCRNPKTGAIAEWASAIVARLASYTEISQSGNGLHVIVKGRLPSDVRHKRVLDGMAGGKQAAIEVYDRARYFAMTGAVYERRNAIKRRQPALDWLIGQHLERETAPSAGSGGEVPTLRPDWSDARLLKIIRKREGPSFARLFKNGESADAQSESEMDFALACLFARWVGGDAERIERLMHRSALTRQKWETKRGDTTYLGMTIAKAIQRVVATNAFLREDDARPTIVIRQELNRETEDAIAALRQLPHPDLFVRGNQLVRIIAYGEAKTPELWIERPDDAPAIALVGADALAAKLDAAARWVIPTRKGRQRPSYPPERITRQLLDRKLELGTPTLRFVTDTPLVTPFGVTAEGYDERTGILYQRRGDDLLANVATLDGGSATQLRRVARQAARALLDPVCDFPFTDDESRAVYLASVLTILARPAIDGPVPLISIEAPTPGTGKTLLAKVISVLATGREPGITVMTESEELRKRITSICLDGPPIVVLDNASGVVRSNALAALFTSVIWEDRLLGVSESVRVPNLSVWFVTGNNVSYSGDLGRRVLPLTLDSDLEDPENRPTSAFHYPNVLGHVRAARPQLVGAALTLIRAYQLAEQPSHDRPRMGSFEAWDALVRGAVIWATGWDPARSDDPSIGRGRVRAEANIDAENTAALLGALRATFKDQPFTTQAIHANGLEAPDGDLATALHAGAADRHGHVTAYSIGIALRRCHKQRAGRLKLEKLSDKRGPIQAQWRVVKRAAGG